MSRSRNRATLGNPLSGLRSRDGNEVPLSITTQKALNASSVSATASLLSQGTQPIAAGTPRRRTARCSSSTSQSHRLSSRRTTRATPTLAAPMRGASPTNAGKSRSRRAASNPSSLGLPPRVRRPPRNAENTPSAVLAATASTVRAMTEPRPVFAVVISAGLSAIPMVGGPLQTVFDAIEERTRHRAETTTREICERVGGADTVLSRIDKNPELEPLLSQAIEAATRTSMEAKRRLLAQAAAAALEDDQKVEPASLIVATLSQLEPVHIHALVRLAKAAKSSPDQDEIQRREVMRAASKVEPVPVLAALIQTGVAIATTTVWHGNGTGTPAEESGHILIHDVSDFGHRLLAYLRAADAGAELLILPSGGSAPTGDHPTPHPSTSR